MLVFECCIIGDLYLFCNLSVRSVSVASVVKCLVNLCMSYETVNAMDSTSRYGEEYFTEQKLGAMRRLMPVNADGSDDTDVVVMFFGSAQVMTPMGAMPLNFALEGSTIGAAAEDFAGKAAIAVEEAAKELENMRREQASQIVVPGQGGGMGGPGQGGIITSLLFVCTYTLFL